MTSKLGGRRWPKKLLRLMLVFAVSVGVLGVSREGAAMDANGMYWQVSAVSCWEFVESRRNGTDGPFKWWLAGYLTAMNDLLAETYNLVGSDDLSGPMLWIENWCGKNPLRGLAEASSALVHELYPRRQQSAPK